MKAIHIIIASALITATALKAVPALADPVADDVAVSFVRTADLDLNSPVGQRQLDRRLVTAAREVCGSVSSADLEGRNAVRSCVDTALAKARSDGAQMASAQRDIIAVTAAR
ncbi:UrcA family protein [Sphingomonas lutea]|uniref:UrcA family protein n=1 Tax=Sphingomonas lutea TaxID=1045317 RepID=A0A7G9SKM5_9SPHN|nr:UrcA family protein [Sphingomonas lutea]QNN68400.1 UrcA family protein [Sphingomonas lutea]